MLLNEHFLRFHQCFFNPLPNNKISDWFKLKAFANDKIDVTEKQKFWGQWLEFFVGKGGKNNLQNVPVTWFCMDNKTMEHGGTFNRHITINFHEF